MSGYRLSPAARNDLNDIWNYTLRQWGASQAERYVLSLRDACDALAAGRRQGQAIDGIRPGYRKLPVGSHFLFYRLDPPARIEIIRILHQRMNVPSRLGQA